MKGNGALLAWMKFDMKKPIIYTSEYLRTTKNTAGVAEAIHNALESLQIKHRELKFTKDYWCRDYMPVMILRYNTPKLKVLHKRALRNQQNKQSQDSETEIKTETKDA